MSSPMTQEQRYIKMTETPISRLIPSLAIPTIISMLVTSIYNMADTFFVSQISTSASAAVGVSYSLINGYYSPQDPELFRDIYNYLLNTQSSDRADTYFILKDFRSYAEAHRKIDQAYRDEKWWARTAMLNTASAGKFSSDRTIEEYVRDIWHLKKIKVELK